MVVEFTIQSRLPSKKNSYYIQFNQSFFKSAILPVLKYYKKMPYWIAPAKAVRDSETEIAWLAKGAAKGYSYNGQPVKLTVELAGGIDVDNSLGVICDGIEKSGIIDNDRQIDEIHIKRGTGKATRVRLEEI